MRPLGGFEFRGIFLRLVAQRLHVLVAEEGVVVEVHLGVERHHLARPGHHQRIDLDNRSIEIDEGAIHGGNEFGRRRHLVALQAQAIGDLAGVMGHEAAGWIDGDANDLLGRLGGYRLDLRPALGGGHHNDPRTGAIDQDAEIELARDIAAGLDIDAFDFLALGTRLMSDQRTAQQSLGRFAHLGKAPSQFDTTGLAPSAGVNLGLDRPDRSPEGFGGLFRLIGRIRHGAAGYRDAEFRHQAFRLIFVNVHRPMFIDT